MINAALNLLQRAACFFGKRGANSCYKPKGRFFVEHIRNGKVIGAYDFPNGITTEGKNYIFDVMFSDATQIASTSWYIGLISSVSYSALADADTMASHAGWTEFVGYTQSNRVAWGPGNPSAASITNAVAATFDINATGTVKGIFVPSNNTKSGTSGVLWTTALFSSDVPVVSGDQLKVTYTINA